MTLIDEMVKLGPGSDWSGEIRRQYEGITRDETRAQLGSPSRFYPPVGGAPMDEYDVDGGALQLVFGRDDAGVWRLVACHLA